MSPSLRTRDTGVAYSSDVPALGRKAALVSKDSAETRKQADCLTSPDPSRTPFEPDTAPHTP